MKFKLAILSMVSLSTMCIAGGIPVQNVVNGSDNLAAHQKAVADKPERFVLENQYILLCDYLSGGTNHAVLGMANLQQYLIDISTTEPQKEIVLFQYLVALQVELQRVGGMLWWDSCKWHDEPWAVQAATENFGALFGARSVGKDKVVGLRIRANIKR
jgi:hypothetical protein